MTPHEQGYIAGVRAALAEATGNEGLTKTAYTMLEAILAGLPISVGGGAALGGLTDYGAGRGAQTGLGAVLGSTALPIISGLLTKGKIGPSPTTMGLGALGGGLAAAKLTEPD